MRKLLLLMMLLTLPVAAQDGKSAPKGGGKGEAPAPAEQAPENLFPQRVTDADIEGKNIKFLEDYFILAAFMQKMQLPDGTLTQQPGRALVMQKGDIFILGFYRPLDGGYVLLGQPALLKGIEMPREDIQPEHNLPCLIARRLDGQGAWRVYVRNGQVVAELAQDDAVAK